VLGQGELVHESCDELRVCRRWKDPAAAGPASVFLTVAAGGGGDHRGKLRGAPGPFKHQSVAYNSTPHPSHTSTDPLPDIALRR
jgi:hypothetical protein